MFAVTRCIAVAYLAVSATAQAVFSTDFDTTLPSQIAPGTAALTPVQGYAGYGQAGITFGGSFLRSETGNVVTLTLASLPAHNVLQLDFLFAAIDSLDGAGTYPLGDYFKIKLDGATVFRESFANAIPSQVQTYVSPLGVQLARHVDLGFTTGPGSYFTDSAYYLGGDPYFASFAHSAPSATITFEVEGPGIQPLADESWAIDAQRVRVASSNRATTAAYGTTCGPALQASSRPLIGQTLALSLTSLPTSTLFAFEAFGLSSSMVGGSVLPMPLDAHGMPGCWLLQDNSLMLTQPVALSGTTGSVAIPIPNAAGFVGLQMFTQGWAIAPGVNGPGVVTSNGLRIRVGVSTSMAITEDFNDETHMDRNASSGAWLSGIAVFGPIGADGRHGTFAPELGEDLGIINGKRTWRFNTGATLIPASNTISGMQTVVSDGKYFFDSRVVPSDVRLRFIGNTPPQFTVAGRLDIQGEIDIAGTSIPTMPLNTATVGQLGGAGGIFGGAGGQGGDKATGLSALPNFNGRPGGDARVIGGRAYATSAQGSGGRGSIIFPLDGLNTSLAFGYPAGTAGSPPTGTVMYSPSMSAGGAGGGHFAPGAQGVVVTNNHPVSWTHIPGPPASWVPNVPPPRLDVMGPPSVAGTAVTFFPFPAASGSTLSSLHFLVGGSGGGGAASNAALCFHLSRTWAPGGGGGGGGGAIALRAGYSLNLDPLGRVLANGGSAASGVGVAASSQPGPGGGGSGGSVVLQSANLVSLGGVVDVRGGTGGNYNRFANGVAAIVPYSASVQATGGNGSSGFVRLEVLGNPTTALLANMQPAPTPQNVGPLTEVDQLVSCRSTFYSTGLPIGLGPEYVRYEIHATVDGIPIVYSDDPAVSTIRAQVGAAVRAWFKAANLDLTTGQPLQVRPWRTSVRSTAAEIGIAFDGLNGFRFLLVVDHAIAQQVTIDRVVVAYDT